MSMQKDIRLHWRDRRSIECLYLEQTVYIRVGVGMSGLEEELD